MPAAARGPRGEVAAEVAMDIGSIARGLRGVPATPSARRADPQRARGARREEAPPAPASGGRGIIQYCYYS